ncbi:hypothetical protein SMGD1_0273 [Sulfurimonas gotlandica GD1]|uniref:Uncharacterized protein n=1 Tax=Sulfurimonas gotlandica (strain DSM 19862 / JCM 16533 / GD1) TaxID=929558 RepID=B6BL62_SULGG|nr:hypothetical protein [Sulfurimonas gotlandica]EDZ62002.1 hypothetical protein CBGD1_2581 [Sulfurimonas gotlandica GD1]EHP28800.1 hypothetical protein SMGD1_0273 [Sulfurimonas gotlandica GD1]
MSLQDLIISIKYSEFVESNKFLFEKVPTLIDVLVYGVFMTSFCWFLAIAIDNDKYSKLNDFVDRIL